MNKITEVFVEPINSEHEYFAKQRLLKSVLIAIQQYIEWVDIMYIFFSILN